MLSVALVALQIEEKNDLLEMCDRNREKIKTTNAEMERVSSQAQITCC